jgi:hypothetical protein
MSFTSKSRRRAVATALGTLAAVGVGAAAAPAADMPFDSKIRLTERFPFAHGKVKSDSPDCIANRKIRLFEEKRKGDDKVIGKTRTGADGKWTIMVDPYSGVFYAKVNQYANESTGLSCLPAKSKKVVID